MSLWSRAKSPWRLPGPGFVTGSSDDDPSGIATYSQTGAQFGYSRLWLALWMLAFMVAIQEVCGRVGMVTRRGLASVLREHYPRRYRRCPIRARFD
jgi:Mn2+/Fe2+ NRAMP family transporter